MRVLVRLWAVALFSVAAAVPAPGARADTLADALVAAYGNSNLLEQNRALLRAADEDVQQAIAALYPVVNFAASATTTSTGSPEYALSMGLTASIPLVDFGRSRLAIEQTHAAVLATRSALIVIEQSVLLGAVQAHLNLYSKLQTLELQRNNVSVITEQLRAARERFELGDSTRTDVALADARLAAAQSALASAQGDVAIAREQYNLSVGRYPRSVSAPPRLPRLPATLEAAQEIARRNHPAVHQAQHQVTAMDIASEIVARQRLGTLTGSLSADTGVRRLSGLPETSTGGLTATLGYQVQLFNGGRFSSAERQQVARGQAQRSSLHQTVAIVQQSVASNWARLRIAQASLDASRQQIAAAQAAFDAVSAEAELGSRTPLDVLDAEQDLLDARSMQILAQANVHLASYALLESTGQLTVRGLGLGIPTYDVEAYSSAFRGGTPAITPSEQGARLDRILRRQQP